MEGTLLEWILGSGIGLMIVKDIFLRKYQNNQDRIDNAIVEAVKSLEKESGEQKLKLQSQDYEIQALKGVIEELKAAWKENNNSLRELNKTIVTFDFNTREQHREFKQLVGDNTAVMQELAMYIKSNKI